MGTVNTGKGGKIRLQDFIRGRLEKYLSTLKCSYSCLKAPTEIWNQSMLLEIDMEGSNSSLWESEWCSSPSPELSSNRQELPLAIMSCSSAPELGKIPQLLPHTKALPRGSHSTLSLICGLGEQGQGWAAVVTEPAAAWRPLSLAAREAQNPWSQHHQNQKGGERKIKWEKIYARITMVKRKNKFRKYLDHTSLLEQKIFPDSLSTALLRKIITTVL